MSSSWCEYRGDVFSGSSLSDSVLLETISSCSNVAEGAGGGVARGCASLRLCISCRGVAAATDVRGPSLDRIMSRREMAKGRCPAAAAAAADIPTGLSGGAI